MNRLLLTEWTRCDLPQFQGVDDRLQDVDICCWRVTSFMYHSGFAEQSGFQCTVSHDTNISLANTEINRTTPSRPNISTISICSLLLHYIYVIDAVATPPLCANSFQWAHEWRCTVATSVNYYCTSFQRRENTYNVVVVEMTCWMSSVINWKKYESHPS